jgi:hypothetical protein
MRIILVAPSLSSLDINISGNVQGDEIVARAWARALKKLRPDFDIGLATTEHQAWLSDDVSLRSVLPVDFVISFTPFSNPWPSTNKNLYFQNAFPPENWAGGTVGMFKAHAAKFQKFIFPSRELMEACGIDNGLVCPFAADTDVYRVDSSPGEREDFTKIRACFVGNNIRGPEVNEQYLAPALDHGLVIYGNPMWDNPWCGRYMRPELSARFNQACHGKISVADEARLYCQAGVSLNAHMAEHAKFNTVNMRVFTILASGGRLVSDYIPAMDEFAQFTTFTSGFDDLPLKMEIASKRDAHSISTIMAQAAYVHANHTYINRMNDLLKWLGI